MAVITQGIAESKHHLAARLIPADVLASLPQAELHDRVQHAEALARRAQAATDPVLRRGYAAVAKAVLAARPRAEVEREAAQLRVRAAAMPHSQRAAELRARAERLIEDNPPAPRRAETAAVAIAKAKAGDARMVAVFNQAGELIGVCDPAEIQPVAGSSGGPVPVGKARPRPVTARRSPGRH
jgi:hypothetical protein